MLTPQEQKEHDAFNRGANWAINGHIAKMLGSETDKLDMIHVLFGKAHNMATKYNGEINNTKHSDAELAAYSEGMRHCLNMLNSWGTAREAYENIINPSIKLEISDEDFKKYH